jgi:REP element-mobilizing transposase RayT/DNA-binding response OmpR family regulator
VAIPLLVVTTDAGFGELLRRSLEEGGRFIVHVVEKIGEAERQAREKNFSLAFLDTSGTDEEILQTGRGLRRTNRHIRFIIASGSGWHAALEELNPLGYLSKPFYLPDLMEMMEKLFPPAKDETVRAELPEAPAGPAAGSEPPWLSDVTRAAQHLTRLTLETSAQAALITRKDELWAYAGQLPQSAARELAETVGRYRDRRGESDLLRFIRLNSTNAEHMLYATHLTGSMMLALIFDAETPFSTIRSQAGKLVRSLSTNPPSEPLPGSDDSEPVPTPSFADILTDVPPPNPRAGTQVSLASSPPLQTVESAHLSRETSPAMPLKPLVYSEQEEEESASYQPPDRPPVETHETPDRKSRKKESAGELSDTRPRSIAEVARKIVLEPVSPSVYNLTYACLLVPRFTEHLLAGDLSDRLTEWVPQICVAFGWRLEHIAVHPDYLQWIVNVPPATSPGYLMRILRQHTSEKIFSDFPRFKKENPSGDFWAPGYLIMGGTQSPPAQLVKEFIQQTRQRQGISQQLKP